MNVGYHKVDDPVLQEKSPYLKPIKPFWSSHSDNGIVIGQNFYQHLHYIHDLDKKLPIAILLPVELDLSGPLPSSSGLLSTCFKCNAEGVKLVSQVKVWYELESYGTYKQADARSAANQ